jgi:hypothetical protein
MEGELTPAVTPNRDDRDRRRRTENLLGQRVKRAVDVDGALSRRFSSVF